MKHLSAIMFWPLVACLGMLMLCAGCSSFFDLDGKRDVGVKVNILGNTIEWQSSVNGEYGKHYNAAATAAQAAAAANTAATAANTAAAAANTAAAAAAAGAPAIPAPAIKPADPVEKGTPSALIKTGFSQKPMLSEMEVVVADGRDWG